jgi:hypothetical protein
MLEGAKKC